MILINVPQPEHRNARINARDSSLFYACPTLATSTNGDNCFNLSGNADGNGGRYSAKSFGAAQRLQYSMIALMVFSNSTIELCFQKPWTDRLYTHL